MSGERSIYDLDRVIEICDDYAEILKKAHYGYGHSPSELKEAAKKLKALGKKWGDQICPYHFRVTRGYHITNSATHHKQEKQQFYVQWDNGKVGRLQFVGEAYWGGVADEWQEFLTEMRSYNALDYDPMNCHIIYDIENGKRVMKDYKEICDRTMKKMRSKVKEMQIAKMQAEIDKLKAGN